MIGDDIPGEVLYLRRYEYSHHSTGKAINNGPWVTWHVVKTPRPGDYRYERGEMVPGPCKTPFSCATIGCGGDCAF